MTSIKEVADAAGVSTATVSRVLADKPHVRPEVRDRVLAVVADLKYRPNRVARSLRVQKSTIVGLIVSDIRNPFFTAVSRAVEDVAYQAGYNIFLCNADEDPAKEALYLELMQDENVAGVILSPTRQTADSFAATIDPEIPMVVIDRRVRDVDVDTVAIDNIEAAEKLVTHLLDDGYRRIGAMFGEGSTTGRDRLEGYRRALASYGLQPDDKLVSYVPAREEDGFRTTRKLLSLSPPPDAIFTSNALLSVGAYRALRESGRVIPQEIAFASFDDTTWTPLVNPAVTVVAQPTYEIGQSAMELLIRRIETPDRPTREVLLKGQLIIRQSCGCNRQAA
jgi:LacI family fructose operon transcriptional repressor